MIVRRQGWRADAPPPSAAKGLDPGRSSAPERNQGVGALRRRRARRWRAFAGSQVSPRATMVLRMTISLRMQAMRATLALLALGAQALVVGLEHRIVPGRGADDGHEQQIAQLAPSALDEASSLMLAAVVLVGRHADQGGRGLLVRPDRARAGRRSGRHTVVPQAGTLWMMRPARRTARGLDPGRDRCLESADTCSFTVLAGSFAPAFAAGHPRPGGSAGLQIAADRWRA